MDHRDEDTQQRNFFRLGVMQFTFRLGWIFKTESIVMPSALDALAGAAWIRGFLPLLSRVGLSLTPALLGKWIRNARQKKRALASCVFSMSASMAMISAIWWFGPPRELAFATPLFLTLYALFFACHGLNQVAFGTLQGKVIPATRRGRLMVLTNLASSLVGIVLILTLLPKWLAGPTPHFELVFLMPAVGFGVAACCALTVQEPREDVDRPFTVREFLSSAVALVREQPSLRMAMIVAALCGFSMVLFPHYQAMARETLGMPANNITYWIVVQSIGSAMASMIAGPLADRHGNRIVLQLILAGLASTPLLALGITLLPRPGSALYPIVFMCIGLTPVMMRIFQNYIIEVADPSRRPEALSALTICLGGPVLTAPVIGYLIDLLGFAPIFACVSTIVWGGWALTFRLSEPRHVGKANGMRPRKSKQ